MVLEKEAARFWKSFCCWSSMACKFWILVGVEVEEILEMDIYLPRFGGSKWNAILESPTGEENQRDKIHVTGEYATKK